MSVLNMIWLELLITDLIRLLLLFYNMYMKKMRESAGKLRKMVKSHHQYVECNLGPVFSITSSSKHNSVAFQSTVQLNEGGQKSLSSGAAVRAERKLVTLLSTSPIDNT